MQLAIYPVALFERISPVNTPKVQQERGDTPPVTSDAFACSPEAKSSPALTLAFLHFFTLLLLSARAPSTGWARVLDALLGFSSGLHYYSSRDRYKPYVSTYRPFSPRLLLFLYFFTFNFTTQLIKYPFVLEAAHLLQFFHSFLLFIIILSQQKRRFINSPWCAGPLTQAHKNKNRSFIRRINDIFLSNPNANKNYSRKSKLWSVNFLNHLKLFFFFFFSRTLEYNSYHNIIILLQFS